MIIDKRKFGNKSEITEESYSHMKTRERAFQTERRQGHKNWYVDIWDIQRRLKEETACKRASDSRENKNKEGERAGGREGKRDRGRNGKVENTKQLMVVS